MVDQPGNGTAPQDNTDPYSNLGKPPSSDGTGTEPEQNQKPTATPQVQQPPPQASGHGAGYSQGIPGQKQFIDEPAGTAGKVKRQQGPAKSNKPGKPRKAIVLLIAVIVIVGIVVVFVRPGAPSSTTSTQYTTINQNFQSISTCRDINAPGSYYLSGPVSSSSGNSACIGVHSDNVKIVCDGNQLSGPGAAYLIGQISYGVGIYNVSNVSVEECGIKGFTYGIASFSSKNVRISKDNMTGNYEPIYFNGTSHSTISDNYISGATSPNGMVQLNTNSIDNNVLNNTLNNSAYYGIVINSTGNSFINNYISKNLYSFACGINAGYPQSNFAHGNTCFNNTGCSFVTCSGVNIPNNVSLTTLDSNVSTCGSIIVPGEYSLTSNIIAGNYIGFYNASLYRVPCIRIAADNVRFSCNNHTISEAEYAIASAGTSNDIVSNCALSNSEYGIFLSNTTAFNVSRATLHGDTYGIAVNASKLTYVNGVTARNNSYAVYLSGVNAITVSSFDLRNNTYGVYFNNSTNNLLYSGKAFNNSAYDVYATNSSAGLHSNLAESVSCGFTDALWAPCTSHISPDMKYFPITTCYTITKPGNYSLAENLVGTGSNCINIKSDNVAFSCGNHTITAASGVTGAFLDISNRKNVSVDGCAAYGYGTAISVSNSSDVSISSITARASAYGIKLLNVNGSAVNDSNITSVADAGILMQNVSHSTLKGDSVRYAKPNATAFSISDSSNDIMLNNYDQYALVGMDMTGSSVNNLVYNNTMQSNSAYDYECGGSASYIGSNNATYNYGTLNNCDWLAALNSASPYVACNSELSPSTVVLTSDYIYTYGAACYSIYAGNFTLNCNNHVIISTNGGTFASFVNSKGGLIENCRLKGFSEAIVASNSSVRIVNSTIYNSGTGTGYGIDVSGGERSNVSRNNVYNSKYGIVVSNENYSIIAHNVVSRTATAFRLENVNASTIENNVAQLSNLIGAIVGNSSSDIFSNNLFNGTVQNVVCDNSTSQCP